MMYNTKITNALYKLLYPITTCKFVQGEIILQGRYNIEMDYFGDGKDRIPCIRPVDKSYDEVLTGDWVNMSIKDYTEFKNKFELSLDNLEFKVLQKDRELQKVVDSKRRVLDNLRKIYPEGIILNNRYFKLDASDSWHIEVCDDTLEISIGKDIDNTTLSPKSAISAIQFLNRNSFTRKNVRRLQNDNL